MLLMAPRRNHNTNSIVTQQTPQQSTTNQALSSSASLTSSVAATSSSFLVANSSASTTTATTLFNSFYTTPPSTQQLTEESGISSSNGTHNNGASNMSPMQTAITTNNNNNTLTPNHNNNNNKGDQYVRCCHPGGECFKSDSPLINLDDLSDCVKVICNNENCNVGQYMHRECFDNWEQSILQSLKSMGGRARSWSDRQKAQNLWTKKGYDLVYKVCGCKCSRGHLRKDLEWVAPKPAGQQYAMNGQRIMNGNATSNGNGGCQEDEEKKKKKNKRNRQQQQQQQQPQPQQQQSNQNNKTLAPLQVNGQQQQQQQQPQQMSSVVSANANSVVVEEQKTDNNAGHQNGTSNSTSSSANGNTTTNVGVIGSGLHHQQQQQQSQQQQQNQMQNNTNTGLANVMSSISNLLNGSNNILGLDLRPRTNSISSASNSHSGSTSPSAISFCSGELTMVPATSATCSGLSNSTSSSSSTLNNNQLVNLQNLNLNGFYPQATLNNQQQQQQTSLMQQQQQQSSLTKNILNGLQSTVLLGNALGVGSSVTVTNNPTTASVVATTALLIKQQQQQQQQCASANILTNGLKQLSPFEQQQLLLQQKVKEVELYSERVRSTSGCNGIFSRRLDFSSFNLLPKTRLNSYQVKIEDEGNHGNDETRLFILSSLAQSQKSRVACILCEEPMLVFDRYPLVDGTFFLSPKQHSTDCIEVKYEGRSVYLTCVCMRCLDGTSTHRNISCRFCGEKWDGSNLVLGTMYAYDIFAAMPCCAERLKCNNCFKLLLHPQQRLNFYSDYSHCVTCPYCATQDTHFVKPLTYCYTKCLTGRLSAIA
ncbi:headcase protein-like isoform X1 [Musca autumnalis]|uniref:headcase protein-like isoform X1 n=1 Tax=Musca autumnalis TaxID=221902 RepID=UPI003CFB4D2E